MPKVLWIGDRLMSLTDIQEHAGQAAQKSPVPEPADAQALDREIERMLELEMAKGLQSRFTEDFNGLMQRMETGLTAEHAAMDKLLRRLKAS